MCKKPLYIGLVFIATISIWIKIFVNIEKQREKEKNIDNSTQTVINSTQTQTQLLLCVDNSTQTVINDNNSTQTDNSTQTIIDNNSTQTQDISVDNSAQTVFENNTALEVLELFSKNNNNDAILVLTENDHMQIIHINPNKTVEIQNIQILPLIPIPDYS
jgi:hypothetical protein